MSSYINDNNVKPPRSNVEFLLSVFGEGVPVWTTNFRGDPAEKWKDGKFRTLPRIYAKDEDESNTYFCISTFKVGSQNYRARRNDLFDAMHVVVIDDVGTKGEMLDTIKRCLEPSYVIETSPDNYQVGYILSEPCTEIDMATMVINSVNHLQGDKSSKGANRVMRLPYGINGKHEHNRFAVSIKGWSGKKYAIADLVEAFEINSNFLPSVNHGRGSENTRYDDFNKSWSLDEVEVMLSFIDPDLFDYDSWVRVLMAIHSVFPLNGFEVADKWSRRGMRYKRDEVRKRWGDFNEKGSDTGRVTIGTIVYYAKKFGWKPKDTQDSKSLIDQLISRYVWCVGQEKFIDTHNSEIMLTPSGLRKTVMSRLGKADERILSSNKHKQVINPTFIPGSNMIVKVNGEDYYNHWKPPGVIPTKGDVTPFIEIMEHVYPEKEIRETMIWLMAHTVVRPEIKVRWVPLIISKAEGIGKTLIFEKLIAPLVGSRFSRSVGEDELFGSFNGYASNTKLMMIEEIWVPGLDGKKLINRLKPIQSNDLLRVNEKNLRPYDIHNYISMVIFSNHIDAAAVSKNSRRYFVYISPAMTMDAIKDGWGNEFKRWLDNGGLENVLWYFQNEVDLNAREAGGNAPYTSARELVASMAEDDFASLLKDRLHMEAEPFENCRGFVSLEDIKSLRRVSSFGNRTPGYYDSVMSDMGWVYVTGAMKRVDGKTRRWPAGWCALHGVDLLKPADLYALLEAQSRGKIDLRQELDEQPEWVRFLFGELPVT